MAHGWTQFERKDSRFRRQLVSRSLDQALFEAVTAQLKAQAIQIKTGTIVDATVIASQIEGDDEARWVKHKSRKAVHGFKAHVGADATTALVEQIAITPANINDERAATGCAECDGAVSPRPPSRSPHRNRLQFQTDPQYPRGIRMTGRYIAGDSKVVPAA